MVKSGFDSNCHFKNGSPLKIIQTFGFCRKICTIIDKIQDFLQLSHNMETPYFSSDTEVEALVDAFINKTLPKTDWTHQAHLAACLWHLLRYNPVESMLLLRIRIITYNESVGGVNDLNNGYHETITAFWVAAINAYLNQKNRSDSISQLCNELFVSPYADRTLPLQFYSRERLFSVEARATFVQPNLAELSAL